MKILALFILIPYLAFAKGHDQGNGGDIIECASEAKTFSLDYVLAKEVFGDNVNIVPVADHRASLLRIYKLIESKFPKLSPSFLQFIEDINNRSDSGKTYQWNTFGSLTYLNDQHFTSLPLFCQPNKGETSKVIQAVIRQEVTTDPSFPQYQFLVAQGVFKRLDPLQRSFLYLHEWLWEFSSDVVQNRKLNYFLHSELMDQLSTEEIIETLHIYGVQLDQLKN